MSTIVLLLLLGLACHRITRVITRDHLPIIAIPRDAFINRWAAYDIMDDGTLPDQKISISGKPTNPFMRSTAYLLECDWCMSIWVSAILVWITSSLVSVPLPLLVWPAVSTIAALIAGRETE